MDIDIPALSLVVLVGPTGVGKTTFAARHFLPTEVVSSDACRAMVGDNEHDLGVTRQAYDVLLAIVDRRLALGRMTVVDATNLQRDTRKPLLELARTHHVPPVAIVFDLPADDLPMTAGTAPMVRAQRQYLRQAVRSLEQEGFRNVVLLRSREDTDDRVIRRIPMVSDHRDDHGPFDIIGDVHGCYDELLDLVAALGYDLLQNEDGVPSVRHPRHRRLLLLGDLVDRGPATPEVLRFVMRGSAEGTMLCVPGNHDVKLRKALAGHRVNTAHGLQQSLDQLLVTTPDFRLSVADFIQQLPSHLVLDGGRLVVAHAGLKESMHGRASPAVRAFALYGDTTGETDVFGLPVRYPWARDYRGAATVVYGHTPVRTAEWLNNTINIDTGCVFGGRLTALRYPERNLVAVPARRQYAVPAKPLTDHADIVGAQHALDDVPDLADVDELQHIDLANGRSITIPADQRAVALDRMSRGAVHPKWMLYLPPTIPSVRASARPDVLEHTDEALDYYVEHGVHDLLCEVSPGGQRCVVVVVQHDDVARRRFGLRTPAPGMIYDGTGRRCLRSPEAETMLLEQIRDAITAGGLWQELGTDWICLEAELVPSLAHEAVVEGHHHATVATAAHAATRAAVDALERAVRAGDSDLDVVLATARQRMTAVDAYTSAVTRFAVMEHPAQAAVRLSPVQLLAGEGAVYLQRDAAWHRQVLERCSNPVIAHRPWLLVDGAVATDRARLASWWESWTSNGGASVLVRPAVPSLHDTIPAVTAVRGRDYLRLLYGADYTMPSTLERLRSRNVGRQRSRAIRESMLAAEALHRFVQREPLRHVHRCVIALMAVATEPVDPRL